MSKRQSGIKNTKMFSFFIYSLSVLFIICSWELLSIYIDAPIILPSFFSIIKRLIALCHSYYFYQSLLYTLTRVFVSFFISVVIGFITGVLCGYYTVFEKFIELPLCFIRVTPVVAFILISLFWFSSSFVPVFAAVLMSVPVIITNTASGIKSVDPQIIKMAECYRFSKKQKFLYVYMISLKPFFSGSCVSAFGIVWKVCAAGEIMSLPKRALGSMIQNSAAHLETEETWALCFTIVIVSSALQFVMKKMFSVRFGKKKVKIQDNLKKIDDDAKYDFIKIKDLSIKRNKKNLYKDFSLTVKSDGVTTIVAPSGCGKTTLLDFVSSLLKDDDAYFTGEVTFDDDKAKRHCISYVFQDSSLLKGVNILENVAIPLKNIMSKDEAYATSYYYLVQCGLKDKIYAMPECLSGGEKKRAAIARAFAYPGKILLMDEPFSSLDLKVKASLFLLLENLLKKNHKPVLFVTHDVKEAVALSDRIIVMNGFPLQIIRDIRNKKYGTIIQSFVSPAKDQIENEVQLASLLVEN